MSSSSRLGKRGIGLALGVLILLAGAVQSSAVQAGEIRVGLIPEMNVFDQMERYEPLADHLSSRLRTRVRLTMLSRYGNIVDRISKNEVDAAVLGSFTGALAYSQLGMTPIARPVNLDGASTYQGHLFVRGQSAIRAARDMRGTRLALVERATTAGYVFPLAYFHSHGVANLQAHFAKVHFWGSHDAAILAVLDGKADVGAAKNTIYERLAATNPRVKGELVILASSARVPSNGLFVAATLNERLVAGIRAVLLGLDGDPAGRAVLKTLGARSFVPTTKGDYQPVFDMARRAGVDVASYRYRNE